MKLSIVSTLYHSEKYVKEFCERAHLAARQLVGDDFEIILVNDGSPDNSLQLAISLSEIISSLIVIDLSRNFGHHKAMMTGLEYSSGEMVFLLDSDLEEEPEWLRPFHERLVNDSCDVVYGVQLKRKGNWFEVLSGWLYYKIYRSMLGINLPESVVTARLMTRQFVDVLMQFSEREMFLGGLFIYSGFNQVPLTIRKHSTSETTYTFRKKMLLLFNSVISFSNVPLIAISYFGVLISTISFVFIFYLILNWFFSDRPPSGWTSVIASVWLLGGLIISFLGIIGQYISRVFIETKRRPLTIVKRVYGRYSR